MRNRFIAIPIILSILCILFVSAAYAVPPALAQSDSPESSYSELLVRMNATLPRVEIARSLRARGLQIIAYNTDLQVYRVKGAPGIDLNAAREALAADSRVLVAEPNYRVHAVETIGSTVRALLPFSAPVANDPLYNGQWGLQRIQAPAVWGAVRGSATTIAVIDTGVQLTHPDLRARLVRGYNYINPALPPDDDYWHGTHVAGIAAAIQNNRIGIAGTAVNVKVLPIKILDANGNGTIEDLAAAMHYATRRGARVINLSLATEPTAAPCPTVLQEAADFARTNGTLVVAAAGNTGESARVYPAACKNVMSVNSTDSRDRLSYFANPSPWVSISAPGEMILSTLPGGNYDYASGTSMATPFVSGAAAMLISRYPTASPDTIQALIQITADRLPWMSPAAGYGSGRLNLQRTLNSSR